MQSVTPSPFRSALNAARENIIPIIVLPAFALTLVLAYYNLPSIRHALDSLSSLRDKIGLLYNIAGTLLFGGLIPLLYFRLTPKKHHQYNLSQALAFLLFWAWRGIEIHLWYSFLDWSVGHGHGTSTVITKMLLDQLLYCPLFAIPLISIIYSLIENKLRLAPVIADIRAPRWYRRRVLSMLITNLLLWVPSTCLIFALPFNLQQLLFNLVLCLFTLIITTLAQQSGNTPSNTGTSTQNPNP